MIHHQHEQGSEEWLQARRGVITGSRFKDAREKSDGLTEQQRIYFHSIKSGMSEDAAQHAAGYKTAPKSKELTDALTNGVKWRYSAAALGYAMDLARERLGGVSPSKFQNSAMRTGTEQEPIARAMYERLTGNLVDEVGFFTTDDGIFGLSPDGLIDDDGVLEIKTMVSSDTLFTAVADGDLSDYIDQCNGGLWLLGRKWVDLVLWIPDMQRMIIKQIERDEYAIESLESDLMAFSALVTEYENKLRNALAD